MERMCAVITEARRELIRLARVNEVTADIYLQNILGREAVDTGILSPV